jgi:hypothetical protein
MGRCNCSLQVFAGVFFARGGHFLYGATHFL